jgi:hypothetical protein
MKRLSLLLLLALVLLGIAIVWLAPATLVGTRIERATGNRLTLSATEGTLWRGRGTVGAGELQLPIAWQVHPSALLRGEVAVSVTPRTSGTPTARGEVTATPNGVRVRNLAVALPASALVAAAIQRPRLDATGMVELTSALFDWPPSAASAPISAMWQGARIGLAGGENVGLGDVAATLVPANGRLTGPLHNTGGDVGIDGDISIDANGGGVVRGVVTPRRLDDARLAALQALGTPEGNGVRLEWRWPGR